MISYGIMFRRKLSEMESGQNDEFGFDDPWVIAAFVLLGILLSMVLFRLWTKYCCEVKLNMQALKQKIGISDVSNRV